MKLKTSRIAQQLDHLGIAYEQLNHERDYTARQAASDCRLNPGSFAKVVGIEADGRHLLAVLPADEFVDLHRFQRLLGVSRIALLSESALGTHFPDCESGAFPPLGNLYGLPVYVATPLARREKIAFNAGTHDVAIRMAYDDFDRMVRPAVMDFSSPIHHRASGDGRCIKF